MAVTADQLINRGERGSVGGPVATSTVLYQGTLAFWNSGGYLDDDTSTGSNPFAGVVKRRYDNSSGANGDVEAECFDDGFFVLTGSGFSQATVGDLIYASDNYTVTTTSTNNTLIGRCVEYISATQIKVAIEATVDQ